MREIKIAIMGLAIWCGLLTLVFVWHNKAIHDWVDFASIRINENIKTIEYKFNALENELVLQRNNNE